MRKQEPRPALSPLSSLDPNRVVAGAVLLAACALLALLLIGFGGDWLRSGQPATVTVQGIPAADRPVASAAAAVPGEKLGRKVGEGLVLAPRMIEGRIAGYAVSAETDAAVLSGAKLRAGDMIIDLDGRQLEPARIRALGNELSLADSVEVTYLRDGQIRKRVIDLNR